MLLLFLLTACHHPASPPPPKPPPKPKYSQGYDQQIKDILALAGAGRWEQAQTNVTLLCERDPKNPALTRLKSWVDQQLQQRRQQAIEDKIREIDAKNSPFNPSLTGIFTEQKDRGLPAHKDVRDAVSRIESAPYIPETYEKTVHEQGPLFDLESTKGRMSKALEKEVSIHLDNVPLETILINLSQSSTVNIVADKSLPALKQVLSVNLDKVKLSEFLRYVARNYDLQFQVGDELVWVVDAKDPKRLMEETKFYRLRKGFVLPAQFGAQQVNRTETTANNVHTVAETTALNNFVNDEAPALPSLERAITNLFTGSKYMIDYEHNLVVARGTPEQLDVMERIIKEFDRPIQQVLIEARFVTLTKPAFMQLGVLWQTGTTTPSGVPTDFTGGGTGAGLLNSGNFPQAASPGGGLAPAVGLGIQNVFTNIIHGSDLSATISALEQSGESQTISAPRLTVLNNRPATISDGQVQYYYSQYSVATTVGQYYTASAWVPSGAPTKITAGAELNVMASISGDGQSILLALNPKVNTSVQLVPYATLTQPSATAGGSNSSFTISLPQYRTEELATRVVVKSGETVVMGGVLERDRQIFVESVPVLGDLPLIGALFRRRTEQDIPRYLLIFVTATIVKDTGEFLVFDDNPATITGAAANPATITGATANPAIITGAAVNPAATNTISTPK